MSSAGATVPAASSASPPAPDVSAAERKLYGPLAELAAASLAHDALPSMHLHRVVPCDFFHLPGAVSKDQRLSMASCGLLSGQSWPGYKSFFRELQQSHRAAGTGVRLKTLYFLRHAQGTHNAAEARVGTKEWEETESLKPEYLDPELTELGRGQCAAFAEGLPAALKDGWEPQLVVVSPLRRALQTAELCLAALPSSVDSAPWVAVESVRETIGNHMCDQRRTITPSIEAEHARVQFHLLRDREDTLWTPEREKDPAQLLRAQRTLDLLFALPEDHIVVVAHSGMLTALAQLFSKPLKSEFAQAAQRVHSSADGAAVTSADSGAPVAPSALHTPADVEALHVAECVLQAPPIDSRHCELQPFCVARLPLRSRI